MQALPFVDGGSLNKYVLIENNNINYMDDNIFSGLSRFGLSNYEIRLYKVLLLYGPNTPTGTVKIAGVPQPRVYDLFNTLQEKGFVDVVTGKKHLYRAVPVDTVIRKEMLWMDNYIKDLDTYIQENSETVPVKDPYIWFVKGNKNVQDRIKSMVYSARNEIIMALSYESYRYIRTVLPRQIKNGITISLVLFKDTPKKELSEVPEGIILKFIDGKPLEMVLVDRNSVLSNLKGGIDNGDYAIYLEEDQLLHALSYYFYYEIWDPSEYIKFPGSVVYYRLTNIWLACDIIDYYLKNNINIKGELNGFSKNNDINIKGDIIKTERVNGKRQTFYISSEGKTYSVGGKSAFYEDIKLIGITIVKAL
jgi:sugar-specific transcriptional regulator TrmB